MWNNILVQKTTRKVMNKIETTIIKNKTETEQQIADWKHPYVSNTYSVENNGKIKYDDIKMILTYHNDKNRPPAYTQVSRISQDIQNNQYKKFTGNPIKFDVNGNLIDGSHRLWAHFENNKDYEGLIIYGLEPEIIGYTDTRLTQRRLAQVIALEKGEGSEQNFIEQIAM